MLLLFLQDASTGLSDVSTTEAAGAAPGKCFNRKNTHLFYFPYYNIYFCFSTGSTPAPTSLYNASSTFRAASPYDQLCSDLLTGSLEETAAGGAAAAGHSSSAVGNLTGLAIACNATVFNGRTYYWSNDWFVCISIDPCLGLTKNASHVGRSVFSMTQSGL